jgi:hypothetical protein
VLDPDKAIPFGQHDDIDRIEKEIWFWYENRRCSSHEIILERADVTRTGDYALTVPKTSAHFRHRRSRSSSRNKPLQRLNKKT